MLFVPFQKLKGMKQIKVGKRVASSENSFAIWGNVSIFQLCFLYQIVVTVLDQYMQYKKTNPAFPPYWKVNILLMV